MANEGLEQQAEVGDARDISIKLFLLQPVNNIGKILQIPTLAELFSESISQYNQLITKLRKRRNRIVLKNQTEVLYWKGNFSPRLSMIHIAAMNKCPVTNVESINYNLITGQSKASSHLPAHGVLARTNFVNFQLLCNSDSKK